MSLVGRLRTAVSGWAAFPLALWASTRIALMLFSQMSADAGAEGTDPSGPGRRITRRIFARIAGSTGSAAGTAAGISRSRSADRRVHRFEHLAILSISHPHLSRGDAAAPDPLLDRRRQHRLSHRLADPLQALRKAGGRGRGALGPGAVRGLSLRLLSSRGVLQIDDGAVQRARHLARVLAQALPRRDRAGPRHAGEALGDDRWHSVIIQLRERGWRRLFSDKAVLGLVIPWVILCAYPLVLWHSLHDPFAFWKSRTQGWGAVAWMGIWVPFQKHMDDPRYWIYPLISLIPRRGLRDARRAEAVGAVCDVGDLSFGVLGDRSRGARRVHGGVLARLPSAGRIRCQTALPGRSPRSLRSRSFKASSSICSSSSIRSSERAIQDPHASTFPALTAPPCESMVGRLSRRVFQACACIRPPSPPLRSLS